MPGESKPGGGLESSAVYKMKNPVLRAGVKGEPIQRNFNPLLGPAGMLFKKPTWERIKDTVSAFGEGSKRSISSGVRYAKSAWEKSGEEGQDAPKYRSNTDEND